MRHVISASLFVLVCEALGRLDIGLVDWPRTMVDSPPGWAYTLDSREVISV